MASQSYSQTLAAHLPALPHIPFLSTHPLYITIPTLLLLSPLIIGVCVITSFALETSWRLIERHVLGTDLYRDLKQPKPTSPWWPLLGNIDHIIKRPPADGHLDFLNEVKVPVFIYRVFAYNTRLSIMDPVAVAYLLSSAHSYDYPKPAHTRRFLNSLLGEGLVSAEGDAHRRARRVLQPAFNLASIRNLTPLFFRHANALTTKLASVIDRVEGPSETANLPGQSDFMAKKAQKSKPVLDVMMWMGTTTMDVIGEAGFGHKFGALATIENDGLSDDVIAGPFNKLMGATSPGFLQILVFFLSRYPLLKWVDDIPTKRKRDISETYRKLETTSQRIIDQKRADVLREIEESKKTAGGGGGGANKEFFEDRQNAGAPKDLMHLMLRANLADDLPASVKLHDHELLGQITTLLLAGQETTSTQLTWCLYTLSQPKYAHIQTQLRTELREMFAGREEVSYEELQSCRLLEKVTLEIMRLISPVPSTTRTAIKDDAIPLSQSYPTRDGKRTFNKLPIKRGQEIFIFVQCLNRAPHLWGDDADDFNPERWDDLPPAVRELGAQVGVAGGAPANGIFTFLAGPRGCIGKSFAVTEFKCILAALVRDLVFEVVEGWEVERKQGIVVRPRIKGQESLGMQMPLYVSRAA